MKRTLFVGDIHGCVDELKSLMEKVKFNKSTDRLIYLGDIINKGPNSRAVVDYIISQDAECLLGNNEIGFLDLLSRGGYPGSSLHFAVEQFADNLDYYVKFFESLPLYIEEDDFIAVHAGIAPGKTPEQCSKRILTTIRTWDGTGHDLNNSSHPPWYELYEGQKTVIYGHYAKKGLTVRANTIGLDSGCVFGGRLSCLIWPSREIVQVQAQKVYLEVN